MSPLKTIIYVDGFNFYYGRLKQTPYKWLDIFKLFSDQILQAQLPRASIVKLKFFTADIKSKFASNGTHAQKSQSNYHRALEILYPNQIEIIKGYYAAGKAVLPVFKKPPDKNNRTDVWKLEEKQTDVNIALHLYRDAIRMEAKQVVIVSNDTDLAPALKMIRDDLGNKIKIGIVIPVPKSSTKTRRPPNQQLSQYADWTRHHILDNELSNSQLPDLIPTQKKPILKPSYW